MYKFCEVMEVNVVCLVLKDICLKGTHVYQFSRHVSVGVGKIIDPSMRRDSLWNDSVSMQINSKKNTFY